MIPSKSTRPKAIAAFGVVMTSVISPGCQSLDLRQIAYSALRQEDCHRNEVNVFCSRSHFHQEYNEYERVRNEFLHSANQTDAADEQLVIRKPQENQDSNNSTESSPLWAPTLQDSTTL